MPLSPAQALSARAAKTMTTSSTPNFSAMPNSKGLRMTCAASASPSSAGICLRTSNATAASPPIAAPTNGHKSRDYGGYGASAASSATSVQKKLATLSFQERERQRQIDHENKLLLGQLLKIERDLGRQKRLKRAAAKGQSHPKQPRVPSAEAWHSQAPSFFSKSIVASEAPAKAEFHASKNKRNMLQKIDQENARLYVQLSKQ